MRWWIGLGLLALCACDDGDSGADPADLGGDMEVGDAALPDAMPDAAPEPVTVPESGEYYLNVRLVEVGDLEIPFQATLQTTANEDGTGNVDSMLLRAVGSARELSDALVEITDLAIAADGTFESAQAAFTLPAVFSPSGSDVDVRIGLTGTVTGADAFCGDVRGAVETLSIQLMASTFAAVPWGDEGTAPPAACDDDGPRMFPRVEACPDLVAGVNTMRTGDEDRRFHVFLPEGHDPAGSYPLVVLHHGLGGEAQGILDATQIPTYVDDLGFVLIAPDSYEGGGVEWDSLSGADSPDLALFDDLLRCGQEKLGVDPARIHVTGMSAGGLYSGYLGIYRAEVIASVAPGSGGLLANMRDDAPSTPFLMFWGGVNDFAAEQDFHRLANDFIADLRANDHPVIACDHGQEHTWTAEFTPWVLEFLLAHQLGDPLAFAGDLPAVFPEYCAIVP